MGDIRAEEILPDEMIRQIQQYVDGTNIYPEKTGQQKGMGGRDFIQT